MMTGQPIGVAFPYHEADREELRRMFPTRRLPAIRAKSQLKTCRRCRLVIIVGPRLCATGLPVVCAKCACAMGMTGFW